MKILITAAAGKTGYEAALELLKNGNAVRIYVRRWSQRAKELEQLGAEVFTGRFDDFVKLKLAMTDIERVYYCYPIMPKMTENIQLFIKVAEFLKIQAVVFMGQRLADFPDQKSVLTENVKESYVLFENSNLNVVYYTPGFFAENLIALTQNIVQLGLMPSPFGDGKCSWISAKDQGRVIAALLENPEPYYGKKVYPTGQEAIGAKEMAEIYSKITGRKVKVMPIPDKIFMKALFAGAKEFGFDPFMAVQTGFYVQEFRLNRFAEGSPTNVVKELTGRDPEDFETIARRFIDESPYKVANFSGRMRALRNFIRLMFTAIPSKGDLADLNKHSYIPEPN